jgi:hypothetical protein
MDWIKTPLVVFVFLTVYFIIGVSFAGSEEFDHEYTAITKAVNDLSSAGCKSIDITRNSRFNLQQTETGYLITARTLLVQCVEQSAALPATFMITWIPPDAREDGTPLPEAEIKGYVVDINGKSSSLVVEPPYVVKLDPGTYAAKAKTVDTSGLESRWSKAFEFSIP